MVDKTTNGIAVRCRGVTKSYGEGQARVAALRGIDLEVRRGELLMLVGPSGCGKTTLISIIAAILDADGGECQVLGRDVAQLTRDERVRFRGESIGFVFQVFNLLPALTALDNVAVPLLLNGVPRATAEQRAREMLESVGLGERLSARPTQLSGGQQQRMAIARALVHHPQLLLCDEPTSNLDHHSGEMMMSLLREVAQSRERALLIVTHDPRIFAYADRIAYMDDGRITTTSAGEAREIFS
jgi:putative ABC transport system ATP-binding protein